MRMGKYGADRNGLAGFLTAESFYKEWQIPIFSTAKPFFSKPPVTDKAVEPSTMRAYLRLWYFVVLTFNTILIVINRFRIVFYSDSIL